MFRNSRIAIIPVLIVLALTASGLGAWEINQTFGTNFAYYTDDNRGGTPGSGPSWFLLPDYVPNDPQDSSAWTSGDYAGMPEEETRNLGSGWGSVEIEAYYRFRATMPFMQGDGALTADNNLRFEVKPVISPATLHVETEVRWTPIAFLQFHGGVNMGTGWPLSFLGLHGLALNDADDITNTEESGLATVSHLGTTFQFDLAAVVPGEMNHVVISLTAKARYLNYSQAEAGEAWYWRADAGQNFNGWRYKGDYALGWQPPWKVNFIGLVAEHEFWMSKSIRDLAPMDGPFDSSVYPGDPIDESWGSDLHYWRFGPVMNIKLNEKNGLTILMQFNNGLYYTEETAYARWFRRWEYADAKYIKFNRIALAYSLNLD